jgi:hypothetical protein
MMLRTVSGKATLRRLPAGLSTLTQLFAANTGFATANKQSKKVCPD